MKRQLVVLVVFVLGLGNTAWAAEKMTWLTFNFPPTYFVSGSQKGSGFGEVGLDVFSRGLPDYQQERLEVSLSRLIEFLRAQEGVYCSAFLARLEGDLPEILISNVNSVIPPSGIVIRKADQAQFLNTVEGVSLEKLLQTPTLTGGAIQGGGYGEHLAPLLRTSAGKPNLYLRASMNFAEFYRMLLDHRVDYVVDYPISFTTNLHAFSPAEQQQLLPLVVSEEPNPQPCYMMCNATPASRAVLDKINAILLTEEYKTAVTQRLIEFLPENLREEYKRVNLEMIGK